VSAAIAFLKDSAGKSEKALFLDATMGGLITSIRGRQSMLALGSINFANTPGTPDIQIVKETNHVHATGPTGPSIPVGGPVVWDYTVTNTGTVPLRNVVVIDNNGTPTNPSDDFFPTFQGGDANGNGLLDIGESWTFTATGTAVGGQYGNTGTVTAESPTGTPVTDSDLGFYFGAAPAVELVKLTNGSDYDSGTGPFVPVGSTVTWTYNVTNTGNVALSDVVVVDDNGTPTNTADDFTVGTLASLAPGASATLTATGIAVAGQYGNIGSASGIATFTSGGTRTVSATNPDHYFGAAPDLQLVKLTNGRDNNTAPGVMVSAGSTVTWTYNVTNTGNVTLSDIIVVDDNGTPLDTGDDFTVGTIASLAPGASATLTATGIAVAGQYGNVGTAKGTDIIGETVTAQDVDNYFTPASLGDFVWYDLNANGLQDSGEPGVANVTVQLLDSSGTNVLQTTATDGSGHYGFLGLTPGSYTVRFLPPDGQVFTTRDVSADTFDSTDSDANPATGMTAVVALAPGETHTTVDAGLLPIDLSLVKTVNNSAPNVGSNVTFTLAISNAVGLSAASGVAVLDVLPAGLTFVSSSASQGSYSSSNGTWTVGNLASGGNATLTIIATVSVPSTAPSPLTNTAEVSAADQPDRDSTPNNRNPTEDDQSSVTVTPQLIDLSLVKTVDDAAPHIGQNVTFTITLGNAAGFSLATGVHVVDLLPAGLLFVSSSATLGTYNSTNGDWAVGTLAGGTSATLTITAGVMASGTLVNTAEVTTADQPDVDSTPNNHVPTEDDQSSVTLKPEICDLHDFTNITYLINGCKTVNDLRGNVHQGDWVQVTFTVAPGVTDLLSFVSYTAPGPAFDPATASQQVVFDVDSGIFSGGTHTLMVRVPNCYFQIDFVCGPVIEHLGPAGDEQLLLTARTFDRCR
jgi:uncharacterized repeat protein (TIGR01451 family)